MPNSKLDVHALQQTDENRQRQDNGADTDLQSQGGSVDIRVTVARLWRKLLHERVPEHRSWEAAGGDSLKLIRFVFEAERALGCDLPLDRFDMSMTQAGFAQAIEAHLASPNDHVSSEERPTVFFLPGLAGDFPALASLRAELRHAANIVPLDYPDWRALANGCNTIEAIAELAVAEIIKARPAGKINLASYSFGGAIALVVARRLMELERQVGHFAIFDTNIAAAGTHLGQSRLPTIREIRQTLLRISQTGDSLADNVCKLLTRWLAAPSRRPLLRYISRFQAILPNGLWFILQHQIGEELRWEAYQRWVQEDHTIRVPARAVLYRSQQRRENALPDLGWGRHFANVDRILVGGDHDSMFLQPHRAELTARFAEQLAELGCCTELPAATLL